MRSPKERRVTLVLCGLGASLILFGLGHWWLGERTFARMAQTRCTVLSKGVDLELLMSSKRGRQPQATGYREEVHLVLFHEVGGRRYTFADDFIYDWSNYAHYGFKEGGIYPCRYDPGNPARATVRNGFDATPSQDFLGLGIAALTIAFFVPGFYELAAMVAKARNQR